jgi:hypothetical protein
VGRQHTSLAFLRGKRTRQRATRCSPS